MAKTHQAPSLGLTEADQRMLDEMETYYSYVLDNASLNISDPIADNIGYFNNNGKIFTDGPKLGRTVVFITKPNLNFADSLNIDRSRMFSFACTSKLGITLARMLMYPTIVNDINYGGIPDLSWGKLKIICGKTGNGRVGTIGAINQNEETYIERQGLSYKISPSCFHQLLSNCCVETSNGKDITLEVKETEGDFSGNRLQYAAGIDETMGPGEITLNFEDMYGSPCLNTFIMWIYYMHYVSKGICNPYLGYTINRIIDYTCSIYVFMLDTDQQTIIRWTKYTGCFPRSVPFGQIMHTKEINMQQLSQISIPFAYNFASPQDPAILQEFNMIAEPALYRRAPLGKKDPNEKFDSDNSCKNAYGKTSQGFFKEKNHLLDYQEALEFAYCYPPTYESGTAPKKLLEAKLPIPRMGISNFEFHPSYPDKLKPGEEGVDLDSFYNIYPKYLNRMNQLNFDSNSRHPYIADGNKLMYL